MRTSTLPFAAVIFFFATLSAAQFPCHADKNNSTDTADDRKVLTGPSYVMNQCVSANNDREDYVRFELSARSDFFNVIGGAENGTKGGPYAIELLDRNGTPIARAEGDAGRSASIGKALPAGTYYVRFIALQGTTHYFMELNPVIEMREQKVKTGDSIAWIKMVVPMKPLARSDFQVSQPAKAGSHWVLDGKEKSIDSAPFNVSHEQYRGLGYVAGKAGSIETVYYRLVFVETGEEKWKAVRITSTP